MVQNLNTKTSYVAPMGRFTRSGNNLSFSLTVKPMEDLEKGGGSPKWVSGKFTCT